ncbi:hypothetical protein GMMP15_260008 [Candidatus Magnetomoraceae bacterium gMMP-15]
MINPNTMKEFKLHRNPFVNEIFEAKDIFLSEDHLFLKEMMLDAAKYTGFCAVWGEVGSGKSMIRKTVIQELQKAGIGIVFPQIIDKARVYPGSLLDAIILDISQEKPKRTLEYKSRQVGDLLKQRTQNGMKQILILEEAHLLTIRALKALKQIFELEDGFKRLIGIILIGQPELKHLLDESLHPELREVIRRISLAKIRGLDRELERYLSHKFQRIGQRISDVFDGDAINAMRRRLNGNTYPLTINNFAAKAMNFAFEIGESKVTAEVINSI